MLLLKRSILTEKVARRGFHRSREYALDPPEVQFIREVMRTNLGRHLYPVIDASRRITGVVTRSDLANYAEPDDSPRAMAGIARPHPVVAISTNRFVQPCTAWRRPASRACR